MSRDAPRDRRLRQTAFTTFVIGAKLRILAGGAFISLLVPVTDTIVLPGLLDIGIDLQVGARHAPVARRSRRRRRRRRRHW
jgi:hypothetical protein